MQGLSSRRRILSRRCKWSLHTAAVKFPVRYGNSNVYR